MNRLIAWIFGERQFYAVQHHGGGTHRHGPYSKVEAEGKAESFRRGGYSAWIESTKGPHYRSPHQPEFRNDR